MKRVVFNSRANAEAADIVKSYSEKSEQAGVNFADSLKKAIHYIESFPNAWAPFHKDFRKFILKPFPHAVVYRELVEIIEVYAIIDLRAEPGYWLE